MKSSQFQMTYGKSTKYPRQQQGGQNPMQNYIKTIQQQLSKNKRQMNLTRQRQQYPKKSSRHRRKLNNNRRQNYDQEQREKHNLWQDRYKGRSKQRYDMNYNSGYGYNRGYDQGYGSSGYGYGYNNMSNEYNNGDRYSKKDKKCRSQQVNIELSYGNVSDNIGAGVLYKDTIQMISVYIMQMQLQRDIICKSKYWANLQHNYIINNNNSNIISNNNNTNNNNNNIKKQQTPTNINIKQTKQQQIQLNNNNNILKQQSHHQIKSSNNNNIIISNNNIINNTNITQSNHNIISQSNQIILQLQSELEQSIEVPQKIYPNTSTILPSINTEIKQLSTSSNNIFQSTSDIIFENHFITFKRISSLNNIISKIPYKSIPALLIIPILNFIISRTNPTLIYKYFLPHQKWTNIYKQINSIAISSKKYLIQEKLLKGMKYISEVQNKLNKIYTKKGFKNRLNTKIKQNTQSPITSNEVSDFEQRKTSTKEDQTAIFEQRKQQNIKSTRDK